MPSTWAGTADTQLVTRGALQDAVDNGYFILKSGQTISDLTRVCTKSYIESKIDNIIQSTSDWNFMNANKCPTKSQLRFVIGHNLEFYFAAPTGYTVKIYGNAVNDTITNTNSNCELRVTVTNRGAWEYYTYEISFSTSTYDNVQGYVKMNGTDCSAGTAYCSPVGVPDYINEKRIIKFYCGFKNPITACV